MAAEMITAASAARGISARAGRRPSNDTTTKAQASNETNWVLLPNEAGTAVRLALEEIGKPLDSPADTLIRPSANSSWLVSMR